jgi:hypothetical protein
MGRRVGMGQRVWLKVICDQATSGLSISAVFRERKLSPASFFNWRRKLTECQLAHTTTDDVRTINVSTLDDAAIASKFIAPDLPLSVAIKLKAMIFRHRTRVATECARLY